MSKEIDQTEQKPESALTSWGQHRLVEFVRSNPVLTFAVVVLPVVTIVLSVKYESFVKLLGVVFSAQVVIVGFALYFVKTYKEEIRLFIGRIRSFKGLGFEFFAESVSTFLAKEESAKLSEASTEDEKRKIRDKFFEYLDAGLPVNMLAVLQYEAGEVDDDSIFEVWKHHPGFHSFAKVAYKRLVEQGLLNGQLQVSDLGRDYLKRFAPGVKRNILLEFEKSINETLMASSQKEYEGFHERILAARLMKRYE